ncbi:MAG: hypothetical protein ACOYJV_09230, partial [Aminivibrio sp.]
MKILRRAATVFALALTILAAGSLLAFHLLPYSPETVAKWATSPVLLDRTGEVFAVFLSEESEWS